MTSLCQWHRIWESRTQSLTDLRVGSLPHPCWNSNGLILCRQLQLLWTDMSKSHVHIKEPGFHSSSPSLSSWIVSAHLLQCSVSLGWDEVDVDGSSLSTRGYVHSLFDLFGVSALIITHRKKKLLRSNLGANQSQGYKPKHLEDSLTA